jgi:hypothetical protein
MIKPILAGIVACLAWQKKLLPALSVDVLE